MKSIIDITINRFIFLFAISIFSTASSAGAANSSGHNYYVEGDLGGAPARIPGDFANLLSFSKSNEKIYRGIRRIKGFGFYVRFPDMIPLPPGEKKSSVSCVNSGELVCGNEFWIYVSVTSGDNYPGARYLNRRFNATVLNPAPSTPASEKYIANNQKKYGLEVFSPNHNGKQDGDPESFERFAEDIYINKSANGDIMSYIKCSRRNFETAPCRHNFSLEPRSLTGLSMSYPRKNLQDWADIERKVRDVLVAMLTKTAN